MKTKTLKVYTLRGLFTGVLAGALIGLLAGSSNLFQPGMGVLSAWGPLAAFAFIFALYGAAIGALIGLDAQTRSDATQPARPVASRPTRRDSRKHLRGEGWLVLNGERHPLQPGTTIIVLHNEEAELAA
ncbi:MAG: hypothetical protein D6796_05575 [Caldilineae bacterium]|nr:MAG: hypothetical protein D6796_05575 [Caldilineae bacterium]